MADQTLGRFVLETPIGTGGMGVVYRAWDPDLHRRVAIKVLKDLDTSGLRASQDLLREARAASTLNHPNICTVHEVGRAEGTPFIVMEHIDGHSLGRRVDSGALPEHVVCRFGTQIADVLAHAHARDIVHRDLKTGNVMVTGDGLVKVLDFGLAFRGGKAGIDEGGAGADAGRTDERGDGPRGRGARAGHVALYGARAAHGGRR
jgi:serine/threonine protein kinase